MESLQIIRKTELIQLLGLSKTTIQNRINEGTLPSPISLGGRSVGFLLTDVKQAIKAMLAGMSEEQLRELVNEQNKQRANLLKELCNV